MRAREFLTLLEKQSRRTTASTALASLKSTILHKIKKLPTSPEAINALEEVQDLLKHVNLGVSRRTAATTDFEKWSDTDVQEAKDLLAKYVISLDQPIPLKKSMIAQWKEGGLIDVTLLVEEGSHDIDQIVRGYNTNPAVKEFALDLLQVSSLGKGKGEFMLKVLSPNIKNPSGNKGDIEVENFGTVEVKARDGGAARFYDRQVKAGSSYGSLTAKFLKNYSQYYLGQPEQEPTVAAQQPAQLVTQQVDQPPIQPVPQTTSTQTTTQPPVVEARKTASKPPKVPTIAKSGLNIDQLATLYTKLPEEIKPDFKNDLINILNEVFVKAPGYPESIVNFITQGKTGVAKQLYGVGSLNNYIEHKDNKGILYIDLSSLPITFTFFTNNQSLNKGGMRLNIETAYPVSSNEQYAFPKITIVKSEKEQPPLPTN
jgi:hypothetical protein